MNEDMALLRSKHFLRGFFRMRVLDVPVGTRRKAALAAARRLATVPAFREAQTVGVYVSTGSELDTRTVFDLCRRMGKTITVPVVDHVSRRMNFALIDGPVRWVKNVHGIPEPHVDNLRIIDPHNLEFLVVPGRAFTPDGVRLGAGGGYFDRFLAAHPKINAVGLAFDEQMTPRLPSAAHDVRLHGVVTPGGFHPGRTA